MKCQKPIILAVGVMVLFSSFPMASALEPSVAATSTVENVEVKTSADCFFTTPEQKSFEAKVVTVRRKLKVDEGEIFRVKAFVKNTGNMPWFNDESGCEGPKMFLGTDKDRDRNSEMFTTDVSEGEVNNWITPNRIRMDQKRINPGEVASFTFWNDAGSDNEVFKEYFTPVVEAEKWIDNAGISFEVIVGELTENAVDLRKKISYRTKSGSVSDIDLNGAKSLHVDISEQKLLVYLGDEVVREFRVSTGAPSTPTPIGSYSISLKQWSRVGVKAPHYIMPRFMMWRSGGYGFHALPSLGTDGGVFWTEARNHIGIPVSHGCIRLLPEDADFVYEFAEIGTAVEIAR